MFSHSGHPSVFLSDQCSLYHNFYNLIYSWTFVDYTKGNDIQPDEIIVSLDVTVFIY